ncbi:hypothetical protein [Brevundimonas sp. DC300-4]|uniref:hypothetical protein n=1 Tax=Brevundimonas sp. DC300-4 TaxID=2804594 RepID=UPI003CF5E00A
MIDPFQDPPGRSGISPVILGGVAVAAIAVAAGAWFVMKSPSDEGPTSTVAIVGENINCRAAPNGSAAVVRQWSGYAEFESQKAEGDWVQIGTGDQACWANATYVVLNADQKAGEGEQPRLVEYLRGPSAGAPSAATDLAPVDTWIEWGPENQENVYRFDNITVTMRSLPNEGEIEFTVTTVDGKSKVLTDLAPIGTQIAFVRMDERSSEHQLLISSHQGGNNQIASFYLVDPSGPSIAVVDLSSFATTGASLPTDIDGDARKEFVTPDPEFAYAFAPGNCCGPMVIGSLQRGGVQDVSGETRFMRYYGRNLAQLRQRCEERSNAACAGYVATAVRADDDQNGAWDLMLRSYDPTSDYGLTGCLVPTDSQCPSGSEVVYSGFPEALEVFLQNHGYGLTSYD